MTKDVLIRTGDGTVVEGELIGDAPEPVAAAVVEPVAVVALADTVESLHQRELAARNAYQNAVDAAVRTFVEDRDGRALAIDAADDALNGELHAIFASRRALTL